MKRRTHRERLRLPGSDTNEDGTSTHAQQQQPFQLEMDDDGGAPYCYCSARAGLHMLTRYCEGGDMFGRRPVDLLPSSRHDLGRAADSTPAFFVVDGRIYCGGLTTRLRPLTLGGNTEYFTASLGAGSPRREPVPEAAPVPAKKGTGEAEWLRAHRLAQLIRLRNARGAARLAPSLARDFRDRRAAASKVAAQKSPW